MNTQDFTPEEQEFRRQLEPALTKQKAMAGNTKVGPCPHPDVLMAAGSGVLTADAELVERHLQSCPVCRQLSQDLISYEYPGASRSEDRRMRAKWGSAASQSPNWWPRAMVAALSLAVIAGLALWLGRARVEPAPQVASTPAPTAAPTPAPVILAFEKAPVRISASSVLTFRGDSKTGEKYLSDLAAALEPYRAGDYAEAELRLANVSRDYPDSAEAAFYLGVSQLLLGKNDGAIESLNAARLHADPSLRDSVDWYSTVALSRAGRNLDAFKQAESLCGRAGEFQQKACSAATQLKPM